MNGAGDLFDPEPERAATVDEWLGLKQGSEEDRDADVRARVAEEIATAIEAERRDVHWAPTFLNGLNHAAEIARGFAS